MKTKPYLSSIFYLLPFLMAFLSAAPLRADQVTNDFESGNREIDKNNCWQFYSTSISATDKINGSYSMRSGALSGSLQSLISPWIKFEGSAIISFVHKMNLNNGTTRSLNIYLVEGNDEIIETIFTYKYETPFNTLRTESVEINVSGTYKVKWEWTGTGGTSRAVMDDMVVDGGSYAADPTTNPGWGECGKLTSDTDTDGDGVIDAEDDYPEDPFKAYDYNFPEEGWGTIAFEDLWPATGDYDFNDMVVDFKLSAVTNANNHITEFTAKLRTRAIGASFHNAFGFQLRKVPAASVLKVTNSFGDAYKNGYFNLTENGLEKGQDEAVIIAYDDAYSVLAHPGDGNTGVNTAPLGTYVEPLELDITIVMMEEGKAVEGYEPIFIEDYAAEYVNMFMVVRADESRGREVHLPGYPPTQLADEQLFVTLDDDTRPGDGKYYMTSENYPWALMLISEFDYPIEKLDIVKAYLHFGEWAESNGEKYPDWFYDYESYRNKEYIYQKE